jgi:hypothetical protein
VFLAAVFSAIIVGLSLVLSREWLRLAWLRLAWLRLAAMVPLVLLALLSMLVLFSMSGSIASYLVKRHTDLRILSVPRCLRLVLRYTTKSECTHSLGSGGCERRDGSELGAVPIAIVLLLTVLLLASSVRLYVYARS